MRRAFTLMELMVVVGIMAFLGLAATSGYNAMQRGIAEHGAVEAASALLKAAQERAAVDRVPTAVYFYNRMLREASADDNAVIVGEAVAIRRAGRITNVQGNFLYDEFGDLEHGYDRLTQQGDLANRKGMRLWRFEGSATGKMQYSVVADAVFDDDDVSGAGVSFMKWACWMDENSSNGILAGLDSTIRSEVSGGKLKIRACAFYDLGTSKHSPQGGWKPGYAYGFEFQTLRLPDGFVFESDIPTRVGDIKEVNKAYIFKPGLNNPLTIDVYACRVDASGMPRPHHKAGTASSKEGGLE